MIFLKTILATLSCCGFCFVFGQTPSLYDEKIASLEVKKAVIKQKGNLKHTHVLGRYLDGGLLVQYSNERRLNGPHPRRKFIKVFWQDHGKDSVSEAMQLPLKDWEQVGFLEMAQLDRDIYYFTRQEETGGKYFLYSYDVKGNETKQVVLPGWDASDQICNPTFFRMRLSGQPVLLFSARPGRSKNYDLFFANLLNNGFSQPRRLPEAVNSPYDETHPFVTSDGTLYFSSNRPPDEDVAATAAGRDDKPADLWEAPTEDLNALWIDASANPLAPPLSTTADERTFIPLHSGLRAGFFTSDRENGRLELYRFWSTQPDTTPQAQYYALIIGVENYQSLDKLPHPLREARVLDSILTHQYCYQVERLENPTSRQILDKLSKYSHLQSNHHLLIAYMGHGLRFVDAQDTFCVLTGIDSRAEDPQTCITPAAFYEVLGEIKQPRHILFLLDACFGGLFKPMIMRGEFNNVSRSVIASTLGKPVPDGGPFNRCLVKTLRTGEPDGTDLLETSLFTYINKCSKESENKPVQFPLPGSKGGEYRFQRCKL